jgi:voltage-gated potassium channel
MCGHDDLMMQDASRPTRRPLKRQLTRFFEGPASVRNAIRVIVVATIIATILGGVTIWLVDRPDFPSLGDGLWWSLQTVTTVGYGDVVPKRWIGRAVGAVVLMFSVAFLSILTAAITTTFIDRSSRDRANERDEMATVLEKLDEIAARIERLEQQGR